MFLKNKLSLKILFSITIYFVVGAQQKSPIVQLRSNPDGAEIFLDSLFIGKTPFDITSEGIKLRHLLIVYPSMRQWNKIIKADTIKGDSSRIYFYDFSQFLTNEISESNVFRLSDVNQELQDGRKLNSRIAIGAASVMISSGAIAAYFKNRANEKFDLYQRFRRQEDLDKTNQLDKYSAVSLVLTEISFAVLVYILLDGNLF
jgi:hypothetical protein